MSAPNSPHNSGCSSSSDETTTQQIVLMDTSPPTSPPGAPRVSPPTSPVAVSPPTSPVNSESSKSSSSSDGIRPHKQMRLSNSAGVSRSTLERRLLSDNNVLINECNEANNSVTRRLLSDNNVLINECNEANNSVIIEESSQLSNEVVNEGQVIADFEAQVVQVNACSSDSDTSDEDGGSRSSASVAGDGNEASSSNNPDDEGVGESADSDIIEALSQTTEENVSEKTILHLFPGSLVTVDEGILRVLKVYIKNRWTKTSLDSVVKLIRSLLPNPNDMPTSGDMLLQRLHEVAPFQIVIEHYYCFKCQFSVSNVSDKCPKCNCTEIDVFYEYSIEPQIKHFFESRNLATVIDRYKKRVKKDGCISDIQDGSVYIRIKSELRGEYDIVLVLGADGVSLSKSSKQEVWSVLCTICEVPPSLRSSFMIICGVFVSREKPRMNTFLKPFVNSLKKIYDAGGVKWTHPQSEESRSSQVVCPVLCADAPAKAYVLNVKSFSHRFGCNICEQKSRKVPLSPEDLALNLQLPPRRRKRPVRRFTFQADPAPLRTGQRMNLQGLLAEERGKSRKGVLGETVACDLPFFDRALCICAEYLHVVCLGVTKYFLELMFCVKGPWYIGDKIEQIDEFLTSIKVPDFVKRLPRSMSYFHFLIGSELRAILLYYSLPAFQPHLPDNYFQHWMLLVKAIFILLQEHISEDDLSSAEIMLRLFVRDVGVLYGDKYYTYNIHNLLHLVLLVRRWGNLFSTGAFDFEKYNCFIVKHVHGTKHIGRELLNSVKVIQSVQAFEGMVNASGVILPHNLPDFELCGKPINTGELSYAEHQAISLAGIKVFKLFNRIKVKSSEVLTSRHYDELCLRPNSYEVNL